ncbi:MAG: ATP-binding protein [Anaerolineae bacterium]
MSTELILVIDDSREMVKHLTEFVLPTFGYKTLYAYDGRTGLQMIREHKPDLVMLDYNLPEMTGIDVLQQMARESLSTPVILMTGYGSELSAVEAFRLGAKDYIIKPFTVDEIEETIDRAMLEVRLAHDKEELAEQLRRVKVELSRQTHEMNTLSNIGKAITSLQSVDKVLGRVLEAATYLTNAEESTIWLPESDETQLHVYREGTKSSYTIALPKKPGKDSLAHEVMGSGRTLRQTKFSGAGIRLESGEFARAVLYAPLKLRGLCMGVLAVNNRVALRAFSKRDDFLLSVLADYAAIALENARVFQAADRALAARLDDLNTLIEITRSITASLELEEVLRRTIQQVHNSWNIEASSLWLLDEKRRILRVLANVGTPSDALQDFEIPVGKGFVGHVVKTGKPIYTNDVTSHPAHFGEVDVSTGFKTELLLCVPLVAGGKIIGAMELLNKQDGLFDDQDVERAKAIAAAVAIAVSNALLFEEAEAQRQHLEATLEQVNSPMLIVDADGQLLLLNQDARSRLGLSTSAIGRSLQDVIQSEDLIRLLTCPEDQLDENFLELTLQDDSTWLPRVAHIPGHGRILILQDATGLEELEKAKEHFVATVSHDMRAPLNTIAGFVAGLSSIGPLNEQQHLFVQRILDATDHMMGLVNGLLELAKVNSHIEEQQVLCNMREIVTDVVNQLQGQALARRISLVLATEDGSSMVKGNAMLLRRAVSNLVDNAIKFSPEARPVQISVYPQNDDVIVKVQDQGRGISEADLSHIFEKFYRGESSQGTRGSGLGLALVQTVAEAHGGQVWVESTSERGSIFYFRLPIADSA